MLQIIQNIFAVLNGYSNGKIIECRKEKRGKKGRLKDLVSISDEARKRCNSGDDEDTARHIDEIYKK